MIEHIIREADRSWNVRALKATQMYRCKHYEVEPFRDLNHNGEC